MRDRGVRKGCMVKAKSADETNKAKNRKISNTFQMTLVAKIFDPTTIEHKRTQQLSELLGEYVQADFPARQRRLLDDQT